MSNKIGTVMISTSKTANAWTVRLGETHRLDDFSLTLDLGSSSLRGIHEGDALVVIKKQEDVFHAVSFARIYRKRSTSRATTFYFDGLIPIDPAITLEKLDIPPLDPSTPIARMDWSAFENALKTACNIDWDSFPVITGESAEEQAYVRELLRNSVVDDLLGPADGPEEEIIGMSVRDRYLVGKLGPMSGEIAGIEGLHDATASTGEGYDDNFEPYTGHHQPGEEFATAEGGADPDDEDTKEVDASTNQSLVPSSLGFTFCVDANIEKVELQASWGRYERTESGRINEKTDKPFRCWKRKPSGGKAIVRIDKRTISPMQIDTDCPEVIVQGAVSTPLKNGDKLVSIFLVNCQRAPEQNQDEAWVFQPELIVRDPEDHPIFRRRPVLDADSSDDERVALEMIYRNHVEFAVGHGISVHSKPSVEDTGKTNEVLTVVLPESEVPVTETPGIANNDRPAMRKMVNEGYLDMKRLAEFEKNQLINVLTILTEDFAAWIDEQNDRIGNELAGFEPTAYESMVQSGIILERLREGTKTLETNDRALEAFRFANIAMANQRVRSVYALRKRRGENPEISDIDIPSHRSWRPFQLAFVLLSVPALSDPLHKDRTEPWEAYADLIWFPTGGGKTEAYLGVAAFTMAIRRLQGKLGGLDASRGLAVIMRYTLRLLTLQQFQRASTLICAMEAIRRKDPEKWGDEPFTIGLWVGQRVTPNTTERAHEAIQAIRTEQRQLSSSPHQITTCPWCGAEIAEGRDIEVRRFKQDIGKTLIYCGDVKQGCDFSKRNSKDLGIPVSVVDEEIYRRPPSMLIATVDKFAMMSWKGQVRTLFGRVTEECERHGLLWPEAECKGNHPKRGGLSATKVKPIDKIRPPDLIIQDEFHLISGPLGTMVGLYETVVDELSSWKIDKKTIRPKIIASTATVRKAGEQTNNVFLRKVSVFPPHGLDVEDNFFSVQRPIEDKPGRLYMGICSPGNSRPAVLIRVYVALLTAAKSLYERFGSTADPYMTLVGYFNSLRELGGMRRLAEDDVQTRAYRVQMSNVTRPGLSQRSVSIVDELTSRVSSKEIPNKLDQLEVQFKSSWNKGETRAIDIMLATNMLSVGVDVNRLGLMIVNGQPKSTAEYIQATSRVGRAFPGLVCTVLTWARPRDLSHYETFEHYHATFYKHVEAQSVTPFSPRALDRGLMGTMVSLLRLESDDLNPNTGAHKLDDTSRADIGYTRKAISDRAWKIKNKVTKKNAEDMVDSRIDLWVKEATKPGRLLGYETKRRKGEMAALLKKPGILAWDQFTVPTSMREVEPGVNLIMDISKLPDSPNWKPRAPEDGDGGAS